MKTENLSTLKIHKLTQAQYNRELATGNIEENALYLTPDEEIDLSGYATKDDLNNKANSIHTHDDRYYTETEIDTKLSGKAESSHSHSAATQSAAGLMSADDKTQIDYGGIPIVTTAGTGSAYTATIDGITSLKVGTKITIIPHVISAANAPTLNVNSLGAKAIRMPVSYSSSTTANGATTTWLAKDRPVTLEYNGTYWLTIGLTRPSANYLSGTVPVANGGTGATDAATAKTNLGFLTSSDFTVSDGVLTLNFL